MCICKGGYVSGHIAPYAMTTCERWPVSLRLVAHASARKDLQQISRRGSAWQPVVQHVLFVKVSTKLSPACGRLL